MTPRRRQQSLFDHHPVAVQALQFDPTGLGPGPATPVAVRGPGPAPGDDRASGRPPQSAARRPGAASSARAVRAGSAGERSARVMIPSIIRR